MTLYTAPPEDGRRLPRRDGAGVAPRVSPGSALVRARPDGPTAPAAGQAGDRLWAARQGLRLRGLRAGHRRRRDRALPAAAPPPTGSPSWSRSRRGSTGRARRVYAILDNLPAHRATDVLLCALAHPRWEFVFQPKYAAYLNLIEPWWKILRSLALKGRRFETWEEIWQAVDAPRILERASPSLRLGPPPAAPAAPPRGSRPCQMSAGT